ncbi:TonB-dependent receptor domain-containing protein [Sphingomonas sp. MMS24-JH45]
MSNVSRSYDDWLPSANVAIDLRSDLIARLSASRVLSRPSYGQLIPAGSANLVIQTASFSNPFLDPIRANTFDAGLNGISRPDRCSPYPISIRTSRLSSRRPASRCRSTRSACRYRCCQQSDARSQRVGPVHRPAQQQHAGRQAPGCRGQPAAAVPLPAGFPQQLRCAGQFHAGALEHQLHHQPDAFGKQAAGRPVARNRQRDALLRGFALQHPLDGQLPRLPTAVPPGSQDADASINSSSSSIFVDASASYNINENIKLIAEVSNITNETNRLTIDTVRQDPLYTADSGGPTRWRSTSSS